MAIGDPILTDLNSVVCGQPNTFDIIANSHDFMPFPPPPTAQGFLSPTPAVSLQFLIIVNLSEALPFDVILSAQIFVQTPADPSFPNFVAAGTGIINIRIPMNTDPQNGSLGSSQVISLNPATESAVPFLLKVLKTSPPAANVNFKSINCIAVFRTS
jgi:hypothetical protein